MRTTYSFIRLATVSLAAISLLLIAAGPSAVQNQVTITPASETPTETATLRLGPTLTPSATLGAPPSGGGLVVVPVLVVRTGPSSDWDAVGGLVYGTQVFPIARSANANWVAIPWAGLLDNSPGWILASLVNWDPALNLNALPVYSPFSVTATRGAAAAATSGPTASPAPSESPQAAGGTLATVPPAPSATPILQASATAPAASATPQAQVISSPVPAASATAQAPQPTEAAGGPLSGNVQALPWPWIGGGVFGLAVVAYGLAFITGQQEATRYHSGFMLDHCPVCQSGSLHLEESRQPKFGVPSTQRLVRCDNCRSVMRQVRPGVWRYTVDGFVNPDMAEIYNGKTLLDRDMRGMAERARQFTPQFDETGPLDTSRADAIVAELEARYLKERAEEEAALAQAEEEAADGDSSRPQDDSPTTEDEV